MAEKCPGLRSPLNLFATWLLRGETSWKILITSLLLLGKKGTNHIIFPNWASIWLEALPFLNQKRRTWVGLDLRDVLHSLTKLEDLRFVYMTWLKIYRWLNVLSQLSLCLDKSQIPWYFQLALPKSTCPQKRLMITNCLILDFWPILRFASFLPLSHKEVSQKTAQCKPTQPMFRSQRSATTSGTCQGPCPPSRSDSSCCWERPHPPPQKNTQKKVSLFESWKLFMLVCKVKMLGEKKKKNNLLKIWSFPV